MEFIKNQDIEIIGNYTLNIFNNLTLDKLKNLKISKAILSPELNGTLINTFKNIISKELIVYGRLPLMTSSYCAIGSTLSKTVKPCSHPCKNGGYSLKDRLRF